MRFARLPALALLALTLLAAPLVADAQQAGKAYRIGYLQTAPRASAVHLLQALEDGLRKLGYAPGANITIDYRFADGRAERLPELAAELIRLNPDVIVTSLNPVTAAVKQATATIPIVTTLATSPVEEGLITSLARPSGNVTGLTVDVSPESEAKRLQLLKELAPRVSRVAVLRNSSFWFGPRREASIRALGDAAVTLGVAIHWVDVRDPAELDGAFAAMPRERPDGLLLVSDPLMFTLRSRIADFAVRNGLPSSYGLVEYAKAGGLMSYGPNMADLYQRAAWYVDRILKGAKPADLPVEQPTRFELVINLKTAKALGLTIPPSVLARADEVIQ
jgi:putative ABC transport system substrate-binding protein